VTDVGANTECKPEFLVQFAIMGSVYAELILGIDKPRVGLVSNGEEAGKGNDLVKETYPLLEESGLNFIGNVEGKEIFGGEVDVAVTDGFTGNVLMKGAEAAAGLMTDELRQAIRSSFRTSLGGLIAKPAFDMLKEKLDPGSIGAVPLLGLDGLVFVGHGRSDSRAILNSIKLARHSVELDLISSIRENLGVALK
jgi:glycerol-3-phosphate acyltransferase PlsX